MLFVPTFLSDTTDTRMSYFVVIPEVNYWLDDIKCNGSELFLTDCMHRLPAGSHDCGPNEKAAVICEPLTHALPLMCLILFSGNRTASNATVVPHEGMLVRANGRSGRKKLG